MTAALKRGAPPMGMRLLAPCSLCGCEDYDEALRSYLHDATCRAATCPARSKHGLKCQHRPGHEGPHEVVGLSSRVSWVDDPPALASPATSPDLPRYEGRSLERIFADARAVCSRLKSAEGATDLLELLEREVRGELTRRLLWAHNQAMRATAGASCGESYAMLAGALNSELDAFLGRRSS